MVTGLLMDLQDLSLPINKLGIKFKINEKLSEKSGSFSTL
jgi:hypothetical protein